MGSSSHTWEDSGRHRPNQLRRHALRLMRQCPYAILIAIVGRLRVQRMFAEVKSGQRLEKREKKEERGRGRKGRKGRNAHTEMLRN
jgi:hypothetical protein